MDTYRFVFLTGKPYRINLTHLLSSCCGFICWWLSLYSYDFNTSLHQFIIRKGKCLENTPEFVSFKVWFDFCCRLMVFYIHVSFFRFAHHNSMFVFFIRREKMDTNGEKFTLSYACWKSYFHNTLVHFWLDSRIVLCLADIVVLLAFGIYINMLH